MSRKSVFQSSLNALVAKMKGSHLTRESRERTVVKLADILFAIGYTHLSSASDLNGKLIRVYISERLKESPSVRTLQNEASHIRSILKSIGKHTLANSHDVTNKALNISGGSRIGTKIALTDMQYTEVINGAIKQGRPGMAALIGLERYLGLRGNEAIHARQDTLERWQRELNSQGKITVLAGAKGGKVRDVQIHDIQNASKAIASALDVAKKQSGFLVIRANGSPSGGLKQARQIYHSWAHRSGIQPHAARYAFVDDQLNHYISIGYSEREANTAISINLGHGDGRGRWVKSVYSKRDF